ncbi:metalloregulator ArsR/SmtB family transcription factor [bacterium]|nr:metalloregulator ArsR/SmtB family transcription factor [bacterium]MCI0601910.1 metalloregulator ArsR/SmtB family transcription factor [bacterium]
MDVFYALAEPNRRHIVEMLASKGQLSATEICDRFAVSPPAISQHLKVLKEANLVQVEKRAQQRIYRINPDAVQQLEQWAKDVMELWNQRFDAFDQVLQAEKEKMLKKKKDKRSITARLKARKD